MQLLALLLQFSALLLLLMALLLQLRGLLLMALSAALQLAASGFKLSQLALHRNQLVFTKAFDSLLQSGQFLRSTFELLLALDQGLLFRFTPPAELLTVVRQLLELGAVLLDHQHLLLLATELDLLAQILIQPGPLAIAFQARAGGFQLAFDDAAAFFALLHVIELAAGLLNAAIKQRHTSQLIDDSAAIAGAHRNDAGDIPLHHNIAAIGIEAQTAQLGLQLLQVAGHPIGAVAGAVGAAWSHPQPAGDGPFGLPGLDPGPLFGGFQTVFGRIGLPAAQIEAHRHRRLGGFSLFKGVVVNQIRQALSAHAAAAGQPEAKEDAVKDVAFA